jgi:hypothetical protein
VTRRPTRIALARVAVLFFAVAATLAFGAVVGARAASATSRADAITARVVEDARAVAAMPARAVEWAGNQLRSPHDDDHLVAVPLAIAALLLVGAWRRAALLPARARRALDGQRAASRAPPASI